MTGTGPPATGPLSGVRVVDLGDLRTALCGRLLADLGADVVWIHPRGAPTQTPEAVHRHAGKRHVALDLAEPADAAEAVNWLAAADVVVENLPPALRRDIGLDPDERTERYPRLVHVALPDLGLDGPLASWRLEALPAMAASGALFATGFPELPPCWMPGHVAHDAASAYGAVGAVAALMAARSTGRGQRVEVSVQEAALASTVPWSITLEDYAKVVPGFPTAGRRNADGNYWVLRAKDGWVRTVIGNPKQWNGFVELVDHELLRQPEWLDPYHRAPNHDVIRLLANESLSTRTRQELFDQASAVGATLGVLHTPPELLAHPQTHARELFVPLNIPGADGAPAVRSPIRLSAFPLPGVRSSETAPRRTDWAGPAGSPAPTARAAPGATPPDGPEQAQRLLPEGLLLDGLQVVELGMAAVGPEAVTVLSELGADVVKIESSVHPDVLRQTGRGRINCGFAFNDACRGRRSVALDLTTDQGRELAMALCARADLVVENFRGGALDALGLGYDDVVAVNPTVVYASSQGYGRGGPLGHMPAYGPLNLGFAGLHHLWNHPEAPYPCGSSLNHPDHVVSKFFALGILAALAHRATTGAGQHVEMAQAEGAAYLLGEVYLQHALGIERTAQGNRNDAQVPHGVYPCVGDDTWVAIAVSDDAAWARLVDLLGWEQDPALATLAGRLAVRDALDQRLGEWTATRERWAVATTLQAHRISAMPVLGPDDHHADAHLAARSAFIVLHHPEVGPARHVANPLRLSSTPQRPAGAAPCLGADTAEVLTTRLGLDPAQVQDLVERGICR